MIEKFRHASFCNDYSSIKELIQKTADINETDSVGRNALMYALIDNLDIRIIDLLIRHGIQVNCADHEQKWTPLHYAANAQNLEAVKILLENNAAIEAKDIFGNTPLWRCVMNIDPNLDMVKLLLNNGANPDVENNSGNSARDIAIKTGNKPLLNTFNRQNGLEI